MRVRTLAALLRWGVGAGHDRIGVRLEGDGGIGNVGLVIRRIEIFAVPTRGESNLEGIRARVRGLQR